MANPFWAFAPPGFSLMKRLRKAQLEAGEGEGGEPPVEPPVEPPISPFEEALERPGGYFPQPQPFTPFGIQAFRAGRPPVFAQPPSAFPFGQVAPVEFGPGEVPTARRKPFFSFRGLPESIELGREQLFGRRRQLPPWLQTFVEEVPLVAGMAGGLGAKVPGILRVPRPGERLAYPGGRKAAQEELKTLEATLERGAASTERQAEIQQQIQFLQDFLSQPEPTPYLSLRERQARAQSLRATAEPELFSPAAIVERAKRLGIELKVRGIGERAEQLGFDAQGRPIRVPFEEKLKPEYLPQEFQIKLPIEAGEDLYIAPGLSKAEELALNKAIERGNIKLTRQLTRKGQGKLLEERVPYQANGLYEVPPDALTTNPLHQPRQGLDPANVKRIVESYDPNRFLPIEVREMAPGVFEVIHGHHRLEAAKQLGLKRVPIRVLNVNATEAIRIAEEANLAGKTLTPSEIAMLLDKRLRLGEEPVAIVKAFPGAGLKATQVEDYARITNLPRVVKQGLDDPVISRHFTPSHAIELAKAQSKYSMPADEVQAFFNEVIMKTDLTPSQLRRMLDNFAPAIQKLQASQPDMFGGLVSTERYTGIMGTIRQGAQDIKALERLQGQLQRINSFVAKGLEVPAELRAAAPAVQRQVAALESKLAKARAEFSGQVSRELAPPPAPVEAVPPQVAKPVPKPLVPTPEPGVKVVPLGIGKGQVPKGMPEPLYMDFGTPIYFDEGAFRVAPRIRWEGDPKPYIVIRKGYGEVDRFATVDEAIANAKSRVAPEAPPALPKPAEAVAPGAAPPAPTIESVAQKIMAGAKDFTPEEMQFKVNNAKAVEDYLKARVAEAVPPVRPPDIPGAPRLTAQGADDAISKFGDFLVSPKSEEAWNLTLQLRKEELGRRLPALKARAEQLMGEGINPEQAMMQAVKETMTGKLPGAQTGIAETISEGIRESLFAKLYYVLQNEPAEMMSTAEALRNALLGKAIPRIPGIKGGSAYSRLVRVFGPKSPMLEMLDKAKALEQQINEQLLSGPARTFTADFKIPPSRPYGKPKLGEPSFIPRDVQDLRTPEQRDFARMSLDATIKRAETPPADIADFMVAPEIKSAFQGSMIPINHQHIVVRALKNAGWGIVDIGNLVRANVASLDQSFGRQVAPLIAAHPQKFANAYVKAWAATVSDDFAKQAWANLWKEPIMQLYDQRGWDYLRPLTLPKGVSQARSVEEFGFAIGGERPIQKFTNMIPWVKFSQRGFVTGINDMLTAIMKDKYADLLRHNEKIASGTIKLRPGQTFDMLKELDDMAHLLEDATGRGRLGPLRNMASVLSAFFFSARLNLGRILSPRHLFSTSSIVRKEAWKDMATFVGSIVGIELLGEALGAWEIGKHGWKAGKIRVGNTWIDPWAGYQQFARYANEMVTGVSTSATTGQEYPIDRLDLTRRFLLSKGAPLVSGARIALTGKKYTGEYFDPSKARHWTEQLAPFALQDISEAFEHSGWLTGIISIPLAISGMNLISATDKLDELAKKEYEGRGLDKLKPGEFRDLTHSKQGQEIQKEQVEIGKVSPLQQLKMREYAEQEVRSSYLGTWNGVAWSNAKKPDPANLGQTILYPVTKWKEDLRDMYARAATVQETRDRILGPRRDKVPKEGTEERALWDYYKIADKYRPKDKKDGRVIKDSPIQDLEGFSKEQDEFLAGLTPQMEKHVLDSLGTRDDNLALEFRRDKRIIKKLFWEPMRATEDKMKEKMLNEAYIAEDQGKLFKAQQIFLEYALDFYVRQRQDRHIMLRLQNRELDELLVKWGYYQNFRHPLNQDRQLRMAAELAVPAREPVGAGAR